MQIITCVWQSQPDGEVRNKPKLVALSHSSDMGHLPTPFYSNCKCSSKWATGQSVFFRTDQIHLLFQNSINRVLRNSIPRETIWVLALVSWELLPNSHICPTIGLYCPLQFSEEEGPLCVISVHFRTGSGWWQVHMINVPEGWPNFRWSECFAKNIPSQCQLAAESRTCQGLFPLLVKLYLKRS